MLLVLCEKVRSSQETTWICKIRSPKEKHMFHSMAMCYTYSVYTMVIDAGNDTPVVTNHGTRSREVTNVRDSKGCTLIYTGHHPFWKTQGNII